MQELCPTVSALPDCPHMTEDGSCESPGWGLKGKVWLLCNAGDVRTWASWICC